MLTKDYYIQYFRLYLLFIYHYTLSIPGYGNTNAITKIYTTGKNKLDVIFVAKCDIKVWDYGKNYTGVNPCVTSCFKCKNVK